MLWLIPLALAGGAIAVLLSGVRDDERQARQRWNDLHAAAERSVEEHQRNIDRHLAATQSSFDFSLLVDVHYSCMRVADSTYSVLKDADTSLRAIVRILDNISAAKSERKALIDAAKSREEKYAFVTELRTINDFKTQVLSDYYKVKEEKQALLEKVQKLNSDTARLKYAIRDRCGSKGADWYLRLEQRKQLRQASRRRDA